MLATCQPGWESHLARELTAAGLPAAAQGPGWVLAAEPAGDTGLDSAFAHRLLPAAREFRAATVNALAGQLAESLATSLRSERVADRWPCVWNATGEVEGLARRVAVVERSFHGALRRRLARVERLADPAAPAAVGSIRGWWVVFVDFDRAYAGREAVLGGQRRMADDPAAPSRSYLKVEEAYGLLGAEPGAGETVADLGAAPGGWSYSAAKRGARVVAIDNGPLKGGARGHPAIEHRRRDAFGFGPPPGGRFDWLFCDLVAEPHQVLRGLVQPWLAGRWCRRFVVNLKFGRVDPDALLRELREPRSPFAVHAAWFRIRHLFHDREEFTVVGEVRP